MKSDDLRNAIGDIDDDLIEGAEEKNTGKSPWASRGKWGAVAAAVLLIAATILLLWKQRPASPVLQPPNTAVKSGTAITGKQELVYGDPSLISAISQMAPGFYIQTVLEVEAAEVLPDIYRNLLLGGQSYRVAKLRVYDQIRGNGFPPEVYLLYPFYDATVFDGYERFIFSLIQVGIEDYALINETQSRVDYFPNMFVVRVGDLGYGSVIAFNKGRVDDSFWKKTDHLLSKDPAGKALFDKMVNPPASGVYPAARDTELGTVKENILKLAENKNGGTVFPGRCDYVTADDVFVSEEAKEVRTYLRPNGANVFFSRITPDADRVYAEYVRVVNGFGTDEIIRLNWDDGENNSVSRSGAPYTDADLSRLPDIGKHLAEIRLTELQAPHITVPEEAELAYSNASGIYRSINGNVYGIIRVLWYYSFPERKNAYLRDDMYYLYDETGNGTVLEREELRNVIGDDPYIQNFSYDSVAHQRK